MTLEVIFDNLFLFWKRIEGDCKLFLTFIVVGVDVVVDGADIDVFANKSVCWGGTFVTNGDDWTECAFKASTLLEVIGLGSFVFGVVSLDNGEDDEEFV